jgi:hypothetical protein
VELLRDLKDGGYPFCPARSEDLAHEFFPGIPQRNTDWLKFSMAETLQAAKLHLLLTDGEWLGITDRNWWIVNRISCKVQIVLRFFPP